jgi:signal transduction histidine kinase
MKALPREMRFLVPALIVLFVGLGILSVFLLVGESSRARILLEYEADRTASSLADAFRVEGSLDRGQVDPRVIGFALYAPNGDALVQVGEAPAALAVDEAQPGFRYDQGGNRLVLERLLGIGGPGMMGPNARPGFPPSMTQGGALPGGMMGRSFGRRGGAAGPAGALFLSMDISSFRRTQLVYRTAAAISPFVIAGLAALFFSLLASNVRHRRRAQEQETLARLGESARTLAHEIRNPLSAIRIQTGLLRKKMAGGSSAQLDAIEEEVERLSLLSRRVADFLKNPRGSPELIRLDGFLRELSARQASSAVYSAAEEARGAVVSFDGDMLRSVVENLVRNAHESYSDDASARGVELALSREKGAAVIVVRDHGRGIPSGLEQKVFDPFFTDKVHGSGVGLSLSRRFVEAAGGTLRLLPRDGGGTEARITLPLEAAP